MSTPEIPQSPQPAAQSPMPRPVTPGSQASVGTYGGRPVSFLRRGTRLQGRRQQAWDEHADRWLLDVPRHGANTTVHPDYVFHDEA